MAKNRLRGIHISTEGESEANAMENNLSLDSDSTQPPSDNELNESQIPILEREIQTPNNSKSIDNSGQQYPSTNEDDIDVEIRDEQGMVRRKRGKTNAKYVWTLPDGHKIVIHCNDLGQPIKEGARILGG